MKIELPGCSTYLRKKDMQDRTWLRQGGWEKKLRTVAEGILLCNPVLRLFFSFRTIPAKETMPWDEKKTLIEELKLYLHYTSSVNPPNKSEHNHCGACYSASIVNPHLLSSFTTKS